MIFEHEIPSGSRLYFDESARIKRRIENSAAEFLEERGYREMVTPLFSYHQHESFDDPKALIRLNDTDNHEVSLRADSTADVVRIATRRLGRSTDFKQWFYIQPVYRFPTREQYQIGAEFLEGDFPKIVADATALLGRLEIRPLLQIANIAIPKMLSEEYGVDLDALKSMHIERILEAGHSWLEPLIRIHRVEDLADLSTYPEAVARELEKMREAVAGLEYAPIVVSPLYYAKLRYYDSLVFRLYEGNTLFATGGTYRIAEVRAAGFAIYTDACIAEKMSKGTL
ncbi:ATP phosphoribosyltransferase regulatory subunit [Nitratifractor salsuginis]|uniref:tRNA synthetase class II (G H P and S) n=1 Tax=Nitratifractor salsuginis (strain DSM 16511 / JCM 12458 / E9I37-1) TaxID=749222 RepID=E6X2I4_NITSE|nr:ATP phosphoribosyltransferase regulatory subunit [Nitratifractor salsuginis]ADV47189.1 tRNA synthetase class II (G H P and S) [Nitratifractor salsuginis DSM 16511]